MKLATQNNDTRDGRLIVVSSDNTRYATPSVATMQDALDDWYGGASLEIPGSQLFNGS